MTEREILQKYHTVAVVGLSSDDMRPSYSVAEYLKCAGYHIIAVNPDETEVLGEKAYPDLLSVPEPVEIVEIFRRSEDVPPHVDEAIAIGAKVIWMQQGIRNEAAAARARAAGLEVVQDRCMRAAHREMLAEA
jgi:predicted CoA-binding protein